MTATSNTSNLRGTSPVAVLIQPGSNPEIIVNAIKAEFPDLVVIEEQGESKGVFVKRRARKLGWIQALGQLATMIVSKFGKRFTSRRSDEILREYGADSRRDPSLRRVQVASANAPDFASVIGELRPAVLFLVSCRMLTAQTLAAIPCPVLNFHAGINPQYRGLQGGYWSRVMKDEENFGATVHLVDAGVDTGDILYQTRMRPSPRDTMHTYPLLQTAAGTGIAVAAVRDALAGDLKPFKIVAPSRQWYHPPIWTWLWNGLTRGIW
ncbi:formyl transferase [Sinorhizobium sp. BG8]|uniref:formyl transferase n=1 Tax=Sinorhizobium sp. BG8 TaxID=2613773 RepID=UPI00193DBEAE|nr:formyl transferase [Sinorhizobium sp. BG8]QRM55805.1 formyl transferase [Sinorhizobium sp. BG8]